MTIFVQNQCLIKFSPFPLWALTWVAGLDSGWLVWVSSASLLADKTLVRGTEAEIGELLFLGFSNLSKVEVCGRAAMGSPRTAPCTPAGSHQRSSVLAARGCSQLAFCYGY